VSPDLTTSRKISQISGQSLGVAVQCTTSDASIHITVVPSAPNGTCPPQGEHIDGLRGRDEGAAMG
jgi:hypothetical protein